MNTRLLVANRGEIAVRIFQAARELGLIPVAIVAPGDEDARHVTYAQEVYSIPSYLNPEAIASLAEQLVQEHPSSRVLIHPGYGFLSERSVFAKRLEDSKWNAQIKLLGPKAETMDALGGKIAAKEIAEKLNIPTIPWIKISSTGAAGELEKAAKEVTSKIGYPALIKAHAGGGGKGMRKITNEIEFRAAFESATREALNSFGDGTLFVERYLEKPRHIEVQVLGDGRGNGVHLYERECTLQRRHQKVWEEAPAQGLAPNVRKGILEAALKLVKETQYRSAGTVEFLVEGSEFFFIEMNTRLQVEHPVTEQITGIDLVHEQIKIELLGKQYQLPVVSEPRGHAIEVRVYAEDPAQEFIPCTGKVEFLKWPAGPGIRTDIGVEVGQSMGTSFDSMLVKIIVHSPNRDLAIERMKYALSETIISGLGCNLSYLNAIAHHADVKANQISTKWLDLTLGNFIPKLELHGDEFALARWIHQGDILEISSKGIVPVEKTNSGNLWSVNREL